MKIVKQLINTSSFSGQTINNKINIEISKLNSPIFMLEDNSFIIFSEIEQVYVLLANYTDIYNTYTKQFDIGKFAKDYLEIRDDSDIMFRNKHVHAVEKYEFMDLPIYRFITE